MKIDFGVFLKPAFVLLMGVEIVEDNVKLAIREGGNKLFMKPRNSTRRRRLECAAMILPVATSRLRTRSWCRAACSRGSGRSRRARSAASNNLAPAPRPGSKAFRRRREPSPWQADRHRGRPHRRLSPRTWGHCSRTRICGRQGRYCARAGSARHTERQHRPMPSPTTDPSTERSPAAAAYPEAPECACSSPCHRSASCAPEDSPSVPQGRDRQTPPPVADNPRLNAHFLGDRTGAVTVSRQQHYSRPPHVALRRSRCPAARLKHLPYLRLEPNFSRFGNHPNLNYDLLMKKSG